MTAVYQQVCDHEALTRSVRAMRSFSQLLRSYLRWVDGENLTITEVGLREAEGYHAYCATAVRPAGSLYAAGTVKNFLKAANVCHRVLKLRGLVKENPYPDVKRVAYRQQPIKNVLSEVQMARLLEHLAEFGANPHAYRVHVVAELLSASGLRIAEAAGIELADLQLSDRRLWVREGKDDRPRMAYLTDEVCTVLQNYVNYGRSMLVASHDRRLFGLVHNSLAFALNERLTVACQALDLPRVTSHCFRHSLGYHLLRSGCDVRYIQAILGHEQIDSTKIYTRVDKEDLAEMLAVHHPRSKLKRRLTIRAVAKLPANHRASPRPRVPR